MVGFFYLWYEMNVGQCTNNNVKWQRALGSMTWKLLVGQNKGTECNEMRNFSLNVIVVTPGRVTRVERNKGQKALMDYGNHLPHPTDMYFFL